MLGHVMAGAVAAIDRTHVIDRYNAFVLLQVVIQKSGDGTAGKACIVAHYMQAAEALHREIDGGLHLFLLGDVGPAEGRTGTKLRGNGSALFFVDIGDEHLGTFRHEELDHCTTDAAGRARNDCHFPRKILCHSLLPKLAVMRPQTRRVTIKGSVLIEWVATV